MLTRSLVLMSVILSVVVATAAADDPYYDRDHDRDRDVVRDREREREHHWVTGRVVSVDDGDTCTILDREGHRQHVSLYGIDAPSADKPTGKTLATAWRGRFATRKCDTSRSRLIPRDTSSAGSTSVIGTSISSRSARDTAGTTLSTRSSENLLKLSATPASTTADCGSTVLRSSRGGIAVNIAKPGTKTATIGIATAIASSRAHLKRQ